METDHLHRVKHEIGTLWQVFRMPVVVIGVASYIGGLLGGLEGIVTIIVFVSVAVGCSMALKRLKPFSIRALAILWLASAILMASCINAGMTTRARVAIAKMYGTGYYGRHMAEKLLEDGPPTEFDHMQAENWPVSFVYTGIVFSIMFYKRRSKHQISDE